MNQRHPHRDLLQQYSAGLISEESASSLEKHLAECRPCEETLDNLALADETFLSELRRPLPVDSVLQEPELIAALAALAENTVGMGQPDGSLSAAAPMQEIGVYRLLKEIGSGGMGRVYKALHTRLDKVVALKILVTERLRDPHAVARFDREMKAVGKLDHPHILRAMDAGEADGRHFLVTEYIEGCDLSQLSRTHGPLPIPDACELIRQAALGLQHAHEHGMVHRDIKPANLFLASASPQFPTSASPQSLTSASPRVLASASRRVYPGGPPIVKVLDLGLALIASNHANAEELTDTGQIMGTINYMAPEQAGDTHNVDIRADIYSLGATLYKLLTGTSIYRSDAQQSVMQKLSALANQPAPPIQSRRDELPDDLAAVVHRLLEKDPEARYATPADVAAALEPFCVGQNLASLLQPETKPPETQPAKIAATTASESNSRSMHDGSIETQDEAVPAPNLQPTIVSSPRPLADPEVQAVRHRRRNNRGSAWVVAGGLSVALLAAAGLYFSGIINIKTPAGTLVIEVDDPQNVVVEVNGETAKIRIGPDGKSVTLSIEPGTKKLVIKTADGTVLKTNANQKVEIATGKTQTIRAWLAPPNEPPNEPPGLSRRPPWNPTPAQQAFIATVAKLQPEQQVEAVRKKLQQLNPGFDGKLDHHKIWDGKVVDLRMKSDQITDISPIRALPGLEVFHCSGTGVRTGRLTDLSPLRGMKLQDLSVGYSQVADLSPLQGMPLKVLRIDGTRVSDLSLLRGMPLTHLNCTHTPVADLSPLIGMKLTMLQIGHTKVTDFSPLRGMKLTMLGVDNTNFTDLSLLRGMPLVNFSCNDTRIADLTPLQGMPLTRLSCLRTRVSDLSPLKGMKLTHLNCYGTRVADLSPLKGMPLTVLHCFNTRVSDFFPLNGMPLTRLTVDVPLYHTADERLLKSLPLETVRRLPLGDEAIPVDEFWKQLADRRKAAEEFAAATAQLPTAERVAAVRARLSELARKPGPGGKATLGIKTTGEKVTEATLILSTYHAHDITPLMAFTQLKKLTLTGGLYWLDISAVKHLPLEELTCSDDIAFKNGPVLRAMATLKTINGQPAAAYWDGLHETIHPPAK